MPIYIPPAYPRHIPRQPDWLGAQTLPSITNAMMQQEMWKQRWGEEKEQAKDILKEKRGYEEELYKRRQKPKIPTTAMQWYLTKNPNASPQDVTTFQRSLKDPSTAWGWFFQNKPDATMKDIGEFQKVLKPPIPKETWGEPKWNERLNTHIQTSSLGKAKKLTKEGYKPLTKNEALDLRKAGAPSMTQIMGKEKFGIQKGITAGELRTELVSGRNKKDIYESKGLTFNNINTKNEVAYWDTEPSRWHDDKTKIVKLTQKNIADGWTPQKVQEFANRNGMTVKEVLKELGMIK